ncbi:MAG: sialate O-acetylesterase [Bacteroidales bacterium]|nr:sialate O-acetylesterase [Bacteroidales bacterium]
MKRANFLIMIACVILLVSCSRKGTDYHLYYLGGQSNMDGYGFVSQLPVEMKTPVPGVMIYHGNTAPDNSETDGRGFWTALQPGHGVGFRSDGITNTLSDRFGIELTFALQLKELFPDENIALVKYSKGGSSIDITAGEGYGCWHPDYAVGNGINQYDHFMATVEGALANTDIDGDGRKDRLILSGIVWMQGETDAGNEQAASVYKENLNMLMGDIREVLGSQQIPVVIGRISESHLDSDSIIWTYGEIVRLAQADFVSEDGNAALVTSTDNYKYSDPWHYDSDGYIDLGKEFAKAMAQLRNR